MDIEAGLHEVVQRAIAEDRIVGSVLIVRQHGETLYQKAHGLADREANRPMQLDAIFRLSSLTKPIVAATILALHDAGQLKLDDPVSAYLPYFHPMLPDGSTPPITIHHLLTHTSGLNPLGLENSAAETAAGLNRWHQSNDAMMQRLAAAPLLFAPGTQWSYGPSIDVLGVIAARLAGGTLDQAIQQYVTDPLRMIDTRFAVTDPGRLAAAYADSPTGTVLMGDLHRVVAPWGGSATFDPGRIFNSSAFQAAGGGMAGTGPDTMLLLEALRTGGAPIFKPETVAMGLSNQTAQLEFSQNPGWQFSYFGAWLEDPVLAQSPSAIGTNRWGGIYGHNWFIDPTNGLSVVSMSNTGLEGCDGPFKDQVRNAVYAGL
jgi:CubicO group peptidase (beta-lactamase class C family)